MDLGAVGSTLQRLLQAGLAPSTQRAYRSGKKKYLAYCQSAKGEQAGMPTMARLPITPALLEKLRRSWNQDPANLRHVMLWAACCVAFFVFLRSGELTVAESGEFVPGQHLTIGDVKVDNTEKPTCVSLQIKQSKTDPFRQGVSIHLHQTNLPLCPVGALLAYLVVRGTQDGPLFQLEDGSPLTRSRLVCELRTALRTADIDASKYAGHNFRIGAATTAAACEVPVDI